MKYALGNMLNGAGGLNADQLALDLPFAVTKSLTAAKGPTPTFTRASSGTFVGSNGLIQSAGNNVARFDHDPVTLASRGLLIEGQRTNLSLHSGALVNGTGWTVVQVSSSVSGSGPDNNSAYLVSETSVTDLHYIASTGSTTGSAGTSISSGTTYTASIFVKKVSGSVDWVQLTCGSSGFGTGQYANFNIGNGTTGNFNGLASGTTPVIEAYANGWYRLSISVTATATTIGLAFLLAFVNNTNGTTRIPNYSGSTSNQVLVAMGQFESGGFRTSYIPTTTTSVIRSADVCSITGASFTGLWAGEATVLFSGTRYDASPTFANRSWSLHAGGSANEMYGGKFSTNELLGLAGSNILVTGPIFNAFQTFKTAHAIKAGDYAGSQNANTVAVSSSASSISPTSFNIGSGFVGTSQFNGAISGISYYKKRLSNSKLVTITRVPSYLSVFVIGSSTAAGTGATAGNSWVSRFTQYYVGKGNVFNLALGGQVISNSAPTGYTIPTGWTANPDPNRNVNFALANGGNIVLINYPSNFVNQTNGTTANYMTVLAAIVSYCQSNGMDYRVFTTQPRNDVDLTKRTILKDTADAIVATYGSKVVNTYAELADASLNLKSTYNSGDGIHPNNAGHQYLYNQLIATI